MESIPSYYAQSDKQRERMLYNALKQKYVGLGSQDTTQEEWLSNVKRDTYASLQGHSSSLEYLTLGKRMLLNGVNDDKGGAILSKHQVRTEMIKKMAHTNSKVDQNS